MEYQAPLSEENLKQSHNFSMLCGYLKKHLVWLNERTSQNISF